MLGTGRRIHQAEGRLPLANIVTARRELVNGALLAGRFRDKTRY